MKRTIAVVTMVYNEGQNLHRWYDHYLNEVKNDPSCLFVIDHGSTDGSTDIAKFSVTRLDRGAGGDALQGWRAGFVSDYCNSLLCDFNAVLYTDCDELVVADPDKYGSLSDYVLSGSKCNATIGFDVLHDFNNEPSLQAGPVLSQRKNLLFVSAMCKPTLIFSPTKFVPGFHCSSNMPIFGDLFRFHLRYADINSGLQRLSVTRQLNRPEMKDVPVDHQKIDDNTFRSWVNAWLRYPMVEDSIDVENADVKGFLLSLKPIHKNGIWQFDYSFRSKRRVPVPSRFMFKA